MTSTKTRRSAGAAPTPAPLPGGPLDERLAGWKWRQTRIRGDQFGALVDYWILVGPDGWETKAYQQHTKAVAEALRRVRSQPKQPAPAEPRVSLADIVAAARNNLAALDAHGASPWVEAIPDARIKKAWREDLVRVQALPKMLDDGLHAAARTAASEANDLELRSILVGYVAAKTPPADLPTAIRNIRELLGWNVERAGDAWEAEAPNGHRFRDDNPSALLKVCQKAAIAFDAMGHKAEKAPTESAPGPLTLVEKALRRGDTTGAYNAAKQAGLANYDRAMAAVDALVEGKPLDQALAILHATGEKALAVVEQPVESYLVMTAEEARRAADAIKVAVEDLRVKIDEFDQARGWKALGYESFRAWALAEIPEASLRHVYRLRDAAEVDRSLGVSIGHTPEAHARELKPVPPAQRAEVLKQADERAAAAGRERTAADVRQVARPEPAVPDDKLTPEEAERRGIYLHTPRKLIPADWDAWRAKMQAIGGDLVLSVNGTVTGSYDGRRIGSYALPGRWIEATVEIEVCERRAAQDRYDANVAAREADDENDDAFDPPAPPPQKPLVGRLADLEGRIAAGATLATDPELIVALRAELPEAIRYIDNLSIKASIERRVREAEAALAGPAASEEPDAVAADERPAYIVARLALAEEIAAASPRLRRLLLCAFAVPDEPPVEDVAEALVEHLGSGLLMTADEALTWALGVAS